MIKTSCKRSVLRLKLMKKLPTINNELASIENELT